MLTTVLVYIGKKIKFIKRVIFCIKSILFIKIFISYNEISVISYELINPK